MGFWACGGEVHLGDEGGLLDVGVGVLDVVVVEADLADGEREGVGEEAGELFEGLGGGVGGLVGVDAGGGEDAGRLGAVARARALASSWPRASSKARCMVSGPLPMPMARRVVTPAAWARARTAGRSVSS